MENKGFKKLICVTQDNNNKYYFMKDIGDGNFEVVYGRVGSTSTKLTYPINKWESMYKQKLKHGYKDVTEIYAEVKEEDKSDFANITDLKVARFVDTLQSYAKCSVKKNYLVASENVTQKQIDEAQTIVDSIANKSERKNIKPDDINALLTNLYSIIPRRMSNVKSYLFKDSGWMEFTKDRIDNLIANEQATLDVMAGQVSTNTKTKSVTDKDSKTLLDAMGLAIESIDDEDKQLILKLLGPNSRQFKDAFKVTNLNTQSRYDKHISEVDNKSTHFFWHGSRNENWWSILDTGLVLRPSNAVITGKMVGDGLYFADKAQKSIGYTSLSGSYWASGNSNKAYLAIFQVHTGNWLHVKTHQSWMYELNENNLKKRGNYDSVFFEGGVDLKNNEYIVYNQNQSSIKYLVEITN